MTSIRSFNGNANTDAKPAAAARLPNWGHRGSGSSSLVSEVGWPSFETGQAWSLFGLQFEEFQQTALLRRGRCEAQLAALVGEHQPCRLHPEQFHTAAGEHVKKVNDIKVGDKSVSQFDERVREVYFSRHALTSSGAVTTFWSPASVVTSVPPAF
jgi:hypothetical protein